MSRQQLLPILALGASLAVLAPAQTAQPVGVLRTIDGRELSGALVVAEDGKATLTAADGSATTLDVAEMMSFTQDGVSPRNVQTEHRVWLRSGMELPAKKLSGRPATGDAPAVIVVTLPSGTVVELPLGTVRAIRHGGVLRPQPTLFAADLEQPQDNEDLIYVVKDGTSQRSAVSVAAITDKRIDFLLRGDAYDFDLDGLCAVVFGANTGFAPDRQPQPRTVVALSTGERLEGKLLSVGKRVRCRLDEGFVVEVPIRRVHRLEVSSDRLVWLSELTPKVEQTPAFDRVWPWQVDRSPAGAGFELAGQRFERGIGLVPHARLTYDLQGRFDQFEAVIGIDDRGGPEAHAVFRVFVDGKRTFESQPMTRGQAPEALRVPIAKAKSLVIEVDFGKNYDLGDFCAFADARVVQN